MTLSVHIGRAQQDAFATVTLNNDTDKNFSFTGNTPEDAAEAQSLVESICQCFPYRTMSKREQLLQLPIALDNGYLWAAYADGRTDPHIVQPSAAAAEGV